MLELSSDERLNHPLSVTAVVLMKHRLRLPTVFAKPAELNLSTGRVIKLLYNPQE